MLSSTIALAGLFTCGSIISLPNDKITCSKDDPETCLCDGVPIGPHTYSQPTWMQNNATSLWDLAAQMHGEEVPLANYRAKAALIVNVASA